MARFAMEAGELEIHHELCKWVRDDDSVRSGGLMLTERRLTVVTRKDAHGFAKLIAHFSAERDIFEIRREDFASLELDETAVFATRTMLTFRAKVAPPIRVIVASDADVWRRRVARWSTGDDLPTIPLPRADLIKR